MSGSRDQILDIQERIWIGVGDSFTEAWKAAHPVEFDRYIRVRSTATRIEAERHPRPLPLRNPGWRPGDPDVKTGLQAISTPLVLVPGSQLIIADGIRTVAGLPP
jgi:hypothetical protein